MRKWLSRWTVMMICCLTMLAICIGYLIVTTVSKPESKPAAIVINDIRLHVNPIINYIEQHASSLGSDSVIDQDLVALAKEADVQLLYVTVDGRVLFASSPEQLSQPVHIKTDVHYDLHASQLHPEAYKIAFPIVAKGTNQQLGNVIFQVSSALVYPEAVNHTAWYIAGIVLLLFVLILNLLLQMNLTIRHRIFQPLKNLKQHMEFIVRGDYKPLPAHNYEDEMSEVHISFEHMRLEMMNQNQLHDTQNQAQKELITNISHDLKTPLTTLGIYTEAILGGMNTDIDMIQNYVGVMQVHTNKMVRLVDDLLIHALKELGQITVQPVEQYSRPLFAKLLQSITYDITAKGVNYFGPSESQIPNVLISIDSIRIEQVLANLVNNALKHTSTGDEISIDITLEDNHLKVMIADTGEGMLPQDMPFVFQRYYQGSERNSHNTLPQEGTGLGLSICKYIIEVHQGTIAFQSKKDEGTIFYFTLPLL